MISEKVNKYGVTVKSGDYWTMHSPANKYFPDNTWIMRIDYIQENGLVPVDYVNWKKKGKGRSYSRMISDFGWLESLKPSTEEEIKYFNKRMKQEVS
ncbi:hypothetical protein KDN24_06865 [Bacillus sp. Bva_UNVM-123]|uniref:hypothetical protein n=1 Tax=Bacillus sp. Bva_UNVM-123 TaxID=2829798 RepID=UPI00391F2747